jgi:HAD superfamily phosphatase
VKPLLVFDMDGVLADVTESYNGTTIETVRRYTGREITEDLIQQYKNQGGWNNDWELTHHLCQRFGVRVPYGEIVDQYMKIFFGENGDGLILKERWLPAPGLLESLSERCRLAIFTGRILMEAEPTLCRFAPGIVFDPLLTADRSPRPKPAPDGLLHIRDLTGAKEMFYVGDTVDDARCARGARVPFIGIAAPANPRRAELARLHRELGAIAVLDDINQLPEVLPS